jgi:hypothetical protein
MSRHEQIVAAIAYYGLRVHPDQLPPGERKDLDKWVRKITEQQEGVSTKELVEAIRHGMPRVWPFNQNGEPYDGRDVYQNIAKAKSAAATMRQSSRIPMTGKEVRARFERMKAEVEHGEE